MPTFTRDVEQSVEPLNTSGVKFGARVLEQFLAALGLQRMIRAHQCVQAGISRFANDKLYTVFSCSSYEGQSNGCGILFLDQSQQIECFALPRIEQIPRASANLKPMPHEDILESAMLTNPFSIKLLEIKQNNLKSSAAKMKRLPSKDSIMTLSGRREAAPKRTVMIRKLGSFGAEASDALPALAPATGPQKKRRFTTPVFEEDIVDAESADDTETH
jgi:hypothetical protein